MIPQCVHNRKLEAMQNRDTYAAREHADEAKSLATEGIEAQSLGPAPSPADYSLKGSIKLSSSGFVSVLFLSLCLFLKPVYLPCVHGSMHCIPVTYQCNGRAQRPKYDDDPPGFLSRTASLPFVVSDPSASTSRPVSMLGLAPPPRPTATRESRNLLPPLCTASSPVVPLRALSNSEGCGLLTSTSAGTDLGAHLSTSAADEDGWGAFV